MGKINPMPPISFQHSFLSTWGARWNINNKFNKKQAMDFGKEIDSIVGKTLAIFLGNTPPCLGSLKSLNPPNDDCVEIGPSRIIGGIRPQNFDVVYRPDGLRIAFDSKTLNDKKSVQKNWQNMINDLATEASTVHSRFPYAIVAFIVIIPRPALMQAQEDQIIRTLDRLASRKEISDEEHLAEAISLVVWDPSAGQLVNNTPSSYSKLHINKFNKIIEYCYKKRYKGLPPHDK